jgi:hypothetical protein
VLQLNAELSRINQLVTSMQTVTLASGVNWPQAIGAAARYDATTIEIESLTQTDNRLQVTGRAINNDAVVRYQQFLLESGVFGDVVVVSMSTIPPPPTPAVVAGDEAPVEPVEVPFGNVEFIIDLVINLNATDPNIIDPGAGLGADQAAGSPVQ